MPKSHKINALSVSLILATLLSLSLIYALTSAMYFTFSPYKILAISAGMLVFYTAVFWNKLTFRISSAAGITAVLGFLAYTLKTDHFFEYVRRVEIFMAWFVEYNFGSLPIVSAYETFATIFLCFSITIIVYLLTIQNFRFFVVITGGAVLFAVQWIFENFISYGAFYLFVFIVIAYYLRYIYLKRYKKENGDYFNPLRFTILTIPLCAAVFIVSYFIPTSSKPIEWEWMDNKMLSASNYFSSEYSDIFARLDFFSVEYTGFGGDGELGGEAGLDTTEVLEVKTKKPTYLKAIGNDTYTGYSWLDTSKNQVDAMDTGSSLSLDLQELSVGLALLSDGNINLRRILTTEDHFVKFLGLKTKSLFIPSKTGDIAFPEGMEISTKVNDNTTISMDKLMRRDFNYRVSSVEINYSDENIKNLLRRSTKNYYSDIQSGEKNSSVYRSNLRRNPVVVQWGQRGRLRYDEFIGFLSENAAAIYDKYTKLPETLPDRVRKLATEVVGSKATDYDKVKEIEKYLSTSFSYNLSPGSTPKGRDFVDYFLFDEKQGYCTYFASSMAVMVRSIGLPARYVEGYAVPQNPISEDTYMVTNENAHAWVEVYFEGFGWVPFEPTPGAFQQPPELAAPVEEKEPEVTPEPEIDQSEEAVEEKAASNVNAGSVAFLFGIAAVVVFGIVLIINTLRSRRRTDKLMKVPPRESVMEFYKDFVHIMRLRGYPILKGETAKQYAQRIEEENIMEPAGLKDITDLYMIARYSQNELEYSAKSRCFNFYKALIENSKNKLGRLKFNFYRYVLGQI